MVPFERLIERFRIDTQSNLSVAFPGNNYRGKLNHGNLDFS